MRGTDRPLAQREDEFRQALRVAASGCTAKSRTARRLDADGVLLGALRDRRARVVRCASASAAAVLVADERVLELHEHPLEPVLIVPPGEAAKSLAVVERLWSRLPIGRDGTVVALGGGSTTDVAGLRRRDVHARCPLDRRPDDADRPGRRRDRRQDRDRHAGREEPRRRVPLSGPGRGRPRRPRDAARSASAAPVWPRSSRPGCSRAARSGRSARRR